MVEGIEIQITLPRAVAHMSVNSVERTEQLDIPKFGSNNTGDEWNCGNNVNG